MVEHEMDTIYEKYVNPILSADPASIEGFIEANASRAAPDFASAFSKLIKWIADKPTYSEFLAKNRMIETWVFSRSVYSAESLETFRDAARLEMDAESYFMERYGGNIVSSNYATISMALRWRGLDDEELVLANVKLYLSLLASQKAIRLNRAKLRTTFNELSRLYLKFAEEKDALISTIDFILDHDMRIDLLKSKAQFESIVKKPV